MLDVTILHQKSCPICGDDWSQLLNDLEKLAHLILCKAKGKEAMMPELTDLDRHILKMALLALCMEHEGSESTPQFRANVTALAEKLGILDDVKAMIEWRP